jgi:hypothetical protein
MAVKMMITTNNPTQLQKYKFLPFYRFITMARFDTNINISVKNSLAWFMVFNTTCNNISVISWRWVLLVEKTGVSGESHRSVVSR